MLDLYPSLANTELPKIREVFVQNPTNAEEVEQAELELINSLLDEYKGRAILVIRIDQLEQYIFECIKTFNPKQYPNTLFAYALKANPHPYIIQAFIAAHKRAGTTPYLDCASLTEIKYAKQFPEVETYLNNAAIAPHELHNALQLGCKKITIHNKEQILVIQRAITDFSIDPQTLEICVRCQLEDLHASINLNEAFGANSVVIERLFSNLKDIGVGMSISFHPGSQNKALEKYWDALNIALTLEQELGIKFITINLGGGFHSRSKKYQPLSEIKNQTYKDIITQQAKANGFHKAQDFLAAITKSPKQQFALLGSYIQEDLRDRRTIDNKVLVEPGRGVFGEFGTATNKGRGLCKLFLPITEVHGFDPPQTPIEKFLAQRIEPDPYFRVAGGFYGGLVDEILGYGNGGFTYSFLIYDRKQTQNPFLNLDYGEENYRITLRGGSCDGNDTISSKRVDRRICEQVNRALKNDPLEYRYSLVLPDGGPYTLAQAGQFNGLPPIVPVAYKITPKQNDQTTTKHTF